MWTKVIVEHLFDKNKVTDHVLAYDAVILAEPLEALVMPLEALHKDAKHLGLKASWA